MDSNTTAGGGVPLDPATASALENVLTWAFVVWAIVVVILFLAVVINYFRGPPKEGLEEPAGCFPGGGDDGGGRAPQLQQPAAEAVVIDVAARDDDAVPMVIICKTDDGGGSGRREPTCAVCLEELAGGGALRALSPCRHCFHSACARKWVRLHATCPLCQAPVAAGATVA